MARDISRAGSRSTLVFKMTNEAACFLHTIHFFHGVHPVKYTLLRLLHGAGGSAAEVQSQLHTALDQGYISQETFDSIYETLEVVAKQLSRFITYLKESG